MDRELGKSTLVESFERGQAGDRRGMAKGSGSSGGAHEAPEGGGDAEEEPAPVNLDLNLVQNLLDSYSMQQGMPGPASTLLGEIKALWRDRGWEGAFSSRKDAADGLREAGGPSKST
jgi:hypothetical protein